MLRLFGKSPPWDAVDYWALDLETSGLQQNDQILSVGMVPIRGGIIGWGEHFYTLVQPEYPQRLSSEGIQAHQIVPVELETAPALATVLQEIDHRISGSALLVHFASVDVGFLKRSYRAKGKPWPNPTVVDTVVLLSKLSHRAQQFDPQARSLPAGLAAARQVLGLPQHFEHHALYDALATAELFLALRSRLAARNLRSLL